MAFPAEKRVTDRWAAVCQPEMSPMRHFLFRWFFTNHQEQAQNDAKALLTEAGYFFMYNKHDEEKNNT